MDLYDSIQAEIAKYHNVKIEVDRKLAILGGIEATQRMKQDAEVMLAEASKKLANVNEYKARIMLEVDENLRNSCVKLDEALEANSQAENDRNIAVGLRNQEQQRINIARHELDERLSQYHQQYKEFQLAKIATEQRKKAMNEAIIKARELINGI